MEGSKGRSCLASANLSLRLRTSQRARGIAASGIDVQKDPEQQSEDEPGFRQFLQDRSLNGDATQEEIEFLRKLRFKGQRLTPLYY